MDLTQKIELYFGSSPVRGGDAAMQSSLDNENEFCAVYVKNDVPAEVHNRTNDHMLARFGVHSPFAQEQNGYIRPYQVSVDSGLAVVGLPEGNARTFRGSKFRVGGTFFSMKIADIVIKEFENLGYTIERKFE